MANGSKVFIGIPGPPGADGPSQADVEAIVTDALAADSTVTDAAAAAVDTEVSSRDLVEGADERMLRRFIGGDIVAAITDLLGRASWVAVNRLGGLPPHSAAAISRAVLAGATFGDSLSDIAGFTDRVGNASWVTWRIADGRPSAYAISVLREELNLAEGGSGGTATVHFVGDLHVGQTGVDLRTPTFSADAQQLTPIVTHRVYVGDIITTPDDATMLSNAQALLAEVDPDDTHRDLIGGNHDYNQFTSDETGTSFMAKWGYSDRRWVRDLPTVRLIGITSDTIGSGDNWMTIAGADLLWLADRLAETSLPCAVVYHAPLYGTVTEGPFPSTDPNFAAYPDADIRAVLDAAPNAVAWISGHTHTDVTDPDILKVESVGSRSVVALNCSAIAYVESLGAASPIQSPVVTFRSDGLDVRWRDHSTGTWMTVNGQPVTSVSYLDLV